MLKRIIKTASISVTIVCLVVCFVPVQAFALDPISSIGLAGAIDAYGMAYGIGSIYDVTTSAGIDSSFDGLWDEFSQFQNNKTGVALPKVNGTSTAYEDYIEEWQANYRALHSFQHSSGKFAAWHIDEESAEVFDQFWDWLLTGPAEIVKVDNQYQWPVDSNTDDFEVINVYRTAPFVSIPRLNAGDNISTNLSDSFIYATASPNKEYGVGKLNTDNPCYVLSYIDDSSNLIIVAFSQYSFSARFPYDNGNLHRYNAQPSSQSNGAWYACVANDSSLKHVQSWYSSFNIPIYSSQSEAYGVVDSWFANPTYDDVSVFPLAFNPITLPNPYGQDYVPVAIDIVTSVPWDDSYDDYDDVGGVPLPFPTDDVPDVVDNLGTYIIDDTYELVEEDEESNPPPQEVLLPFIPVNIPSFNFNFSGIWHYVREWVSSLGAWFTTLFSIWSILPYAMVVPVYATAVVVIVLGVYKRFFM